MKKELINGKKKRKIPFFGISKIMVMTKRKNEWKKDFLAFCEPKHKNDKGNHAFS